MRVVYFSVDFPVMISIHPFSYNHSPSLQLDAWRSPWFLAVNLCICFHHLLDKDSLMTEWLPRKTSSGTLFSIARSLTWCLFLHVTPFIPSLEHSYISLSVWASSSGPHAIHSWSFPLPRNIHSQSLTISLTSVVILITACFSIT